jgi:tetratricopeptide (TPR) repeat protein/opacity protein-like surface antigen
MTYRFHSAVHIATMLFSLFFLSGMASAESCTDWVAKLDSFQGKVQTRRISSVEWKQVSQKDSFCAGDMLRVMEKSRAVIVLKNDTVMRLDQNTTITLSLPTQSKPSLLDLLKGAAYFISRTPQKFRVNTPFLNAGVEGTEFLVTVRDIDAMVSVFEGTVLAENSVGSIRLTQGQTASAVEGRAPLMSLTIKPKDAVQWTLHYPIISINKTYESLSARVSSLLSAGAAVEAEVELSKVLSAEPGNADALSFMSIIAVSQNEKEKALEYARKAVSSAPNSGSAHIALSHALQARFDLKGAMQSVRTAVQLDPDNALAWARLSELALSLGDKDEALNAAEKAASLAPELSRTQTVLGFAHLSQIETDEAMTAFEKAADLDSADPLPRLGLGLAKIRKGHLEAGRREIEIAVSLDTGNALIRSYLGKAYYEEKRDNVATDQFSMAKEADPKDPTAYFYSAIQKQAENRPVEALQDLQRSMELNDNRAVYRSRLLLDEDQAARGAGLARIYDDLGFQQLALSEGNKSVNADPANASAHRFLSDSYATLPRHEISRVSELLQSQLLQPVGFNPVQPHLAEPGLFILQGAGPSDAGFNEYNQLFDRNRISLLMSGVVGSNSTFGDEMVVSGLHEKLSFSVGQFHYETNGFRKNNDQKQDIYNVFAQVRITADTSVMLELRSSNKSYGDLTLNFNPDDFLPASRNEMKTDSVRIGFKQNVTSDSMIIGTFLREYSKMTSSDAVYFIDTSFGFPIEIGLLDDLRSRGNLYGAELQYLYKSEHFNVVAGGGYFRLKRKDKDDFRVSFDGLIVDESVTATESDIGHANLYFYSRIQLPQNVTLTLGASVDAMKDRADSIADRNLISPKIGITYSPILGTTLRAAAFRVLRKTLPTTNQTIEPTTVAGFNQFFDDPQGTDSWRYGFGLDQKISSNIYCGIEYSWRDLNVPLPPGSQEAEWKEKLGRIYLYWMPHPWVALTAEYLFEKFDRDLVYTEGIDSLRTNRIPVGLHLAHPSGFSAWLKATHFDQKGRFQRQLTDFSLPGEPGSSHFWIVDSTMSYRLPKRTGMVSIEARNLFNQSFRFQDTDPFNPIIQPSRSVFMKLTLAW